MQQIGEENKGCELTVIKFTNHVNVNYHHCGFYGNTDVRNLFHKF